MSGERKNLRPLLPLCKNVILEVFLSETFGKMLRSESSDGRDKFEVESRRLREMAERLEVLEERERKLSKRKREESDSILGARMGERVLKVHVIQRVVSQRGR